MALNRRMRGGFVAVGLGLVLQIAASFHWTPGTFILSAAIGVPLVIAGAIVLWLGTRGAT